MTVRFERPAGHVVERGDAAPARPRCAYVQRAESAVPDGQPGRVQRVRAAHVHGARRSRDAGRSVSRVHHTGTDAELDALARDVQEIVREAKHVFGEYPPFEGNTYTFIADYLPWANGDGMEHRNSTILTSSDSLRANRLDLLDTVSHEFFHSWNIERIRPQSLEPFNLDEANMSGELWLAEGFTNYYGALVLKRSGLSTVGVCAGHGRGARHRRQQSRPRVQQRGGDEPDGAVRRSRLRSRSDEFRRTRSSRTTRGDRRSASGST